MGEAFQNTNLVDDQGHRKARDFLRCAEAQHGTVGSHIEACLNVCGTLPTKCELREATYGWEADHGEETDGMGGDQGYMRPQWVGQCLDICD